MWLSQGINGKLRKLLKCSLLSSNWMARIRSCFKQNAFFTVSMMGSLERIKQQIHFTTTSSLHSNFTNFSLYVSEYTSIFKITRYSETPIKRTPWVAKCLLTINTQRLLCTVIKFHFVKEAEEAVLYFVQDF